MGNVGQRLAKYPLQVPPLTQGNEAAELMIGKPYAEIQRQTA